MKRPVSFYFTRNSLVLTLAIEFVFLVVGVLAALFIVFAAGDLDVRLRATLSAMSLGLAGSAAYYLRRVYRAAFDERLFVVTGAENPRERLATNLYLRGRPIISLPMTLAVSLGIILTYTSVAPDSASPTSDLIYLTGSLGFVTGFLGGRTIEQLEKNGKV